MSGGDAAGFGYVHVASDGRRFRTAGELERYERVGGRHPLEVLRAAGRAAAARGETVAGIPACSRCGGSGSDNTRPWDAEHLPAPCPRCKGSGAEPAEPWAPGDGLEDAGGGDAGA